MLFHAIILIAIYLIENGAKTVKMLTAEFDCLGEDIGCSFQINVDSRLCLKDGLGQ